MPRKKNDPVKTPQGKPLSSDPRDCHRCGHRLNLHICGCYACWNAKGTKGPCLGIKPEASGIGGSGCGKP